MIPTNKGEAVIDSLSGDRTSTALDERLESAAQSLAALLKCNSTLFHRLENGDFVLEIPMAKTQWIS
jgi:hypothetical protein